MWAISDIFRFSSGGSPLTQRFTASWRSWSIQFRLSPAITTAFSQGLVTLLQGLLLDLGRSLTSKLFPVRRGRALIALYTTYEMLPQSDVGTAAWPMEAYGRASHQRGSLKHGTGNDNNPQVAVIPTTPRTSLWPGTESALILVFLFFSFLYSERYGHNLCTV